MPLRTPKKTKGGIEPELASVRTGIKAGPGSKDVHHTDNTLGHLNSPYGVSECAGADEACRYESQCKGSIALLWNFSTIADQRSARERAFSSLSYEEAWTYTVACGQAGPLT